MDDCCAPGRSGDPQAVGSGALAISQHTGGSAGIACSPPTAALPGGSFVMGNPRGDGYADDGEGPAHEVDLSPFAIGIHAVTNDEFAAFVSATGHRTAADAFGTSFVFAGLLPDDFPPTRAIAAAPWWREVPGATWRTPEGPLSDLSGRGLHPVVHVSWDDAVAYCAWAGARLPTEAEWEYAARGGRPGTPFPWGDEREPGGEHRMNTFQGSFPASDTGDDGWIGTAPVGRYPANGFGLRDVTGNVWEWCADWFHPAAYAQADTRDPTGPPVGSARVMRGGSYLCHESYCRRYRVDARSSNTPDSSAGNVGFRIAR